jgi:hypothetical protein
MSQVLSAYLRVRSGLTLALSQGLGFPVTYSNLLYTRQARVLTIPHHPLNPLSLNTNHCKLLTSPILMSNSHPSTSTSTSTATSSTNFQLIFNNALKEYEKRTKNDLLAHPLAAELQDCNSPSAILAVLRRQVQGLGQSPRSDDRWTKWLDPTVNVLHTLSNTFGQGVSLVRFRK